MLIIAGSHVSHAVPYLITPRINVVALGLERQIVGFRRPLRAAFAQQPMEAAMEHYVHQANIDHYRRLIAESERGPARDEDRHAMLLTLLAEEIAKDRKPIDRVAVSYRVKDGRLIPKG